MKIMQIAPFGLPVREDIKYGGIERSIFNLDKEFIRQGHESLVVATENSSVYGILCPTLSKNTFILKNNEDGGRRYENIANKLDYEEHCSKTLQYILEKKPDIINDQFHEHPGFLRSKQFKENKDLPPVLRTLRGPLNPDNVKKFKELRKSVEGRNVYFCTLSESQKKDFDKIIPINYVVGNGIDLESFPFQDEGEGYVFSLGLICDYKGQDIALKASKELGKKIIMAGPVHDFAPKIKKYWEEEIKPRLDLILDKEISPQEVGKFVDEFMGSKYNSAYIGELDDSQKKEFYKRADAFYFPIGWSEAFGSVMIESNACGTPVVAYDGGSVPEIIEHGKNGYVINQGDFKNFLHYASKVGDLSRKACRNYAEKNFTIEKQTNNLLKVYNDVISKSKN